MPRHPGANPLGVGNATAGSWFSQALGVGEVITSLRSVQVELSAHFEKLLSVHPLLEGMQLCCQVSTVAPQFRLHSTGAHGRQPALGAGLLCLPAQCLGQGTTALMKHHEQKQAGEKKGLCGLHFHTVVHHRRKSGQELSRAGSWTQELMQGP